MVCKNSVLDSFAKFTRKHLCRSLLLKNIIGCIGIFVLHRCLNSIEAVNCFREKVRSQMFDWVLKTLLASLGCVRYLAISIIMATLASCDQVIF